MRLGSRQHLCTPLVSSAADVEETKRFDIEIDFGSGWWAPDRSTRMGRMLSDHQSRRRGKPGSTQDQCGSAWQARASRASAAKRQLIFHLA
jgi:hypothetical protein